jgi:pimeloyl-ACP methyl ester carboxylesterase
MSELAEATRVSSVVHEDVLFSLCGTTVRGTLTVPPDPRGLVIVVEPDDLARRPWAQATVGDLEDGGFATFLTDLALPGERNEPDEIDDVKRTVDRLIAVSDRLRARPDLDRSPVGLIGFGAGAAAALWTGALLSREVAAVVSVNGRPDLVTRWVNLVGAPTLLVVDTKDQVLLDINVAAFRNMHCEAALEILNGSDGGSIRLATSWLRGYLSSAREVPPSWLA